MCLDYIENEKKQPRTISEDRCTKQHKKQMNRATQSFLLKKMGDAMYFLERETDRQKSLHKSE